MNLTLLRPLTAELVGTALFVFLGAGSVVVSAAFPGAIGVIGVAAAHGIGLAVLVSATMNVSGGHLNPAVTIGLFAARKIDAKTAGAYVAAQLVGAILGAAFVTWFLPAGAVNVTNAGLPAVAAAVTGKQAVALEALLTFVLMSAVIGTAVSKDAPKIGGFGIGLAVFAASIVGGPLTGAALNPARAFGPALVAWEFQAQGLYWVAPVLGATLAAVLWKFVLLPKEP
ncbi:MAG TPA: aquaporin [Gemmatimonadales bacterium]